MNLENMIQIGRSESEMLTYSVIPLMRSLEESYPQRQKVERRLPEAESCERWHLM
jgi:hypothetical protein